MEALASGISSAVHGASASVDAFARHRRLDAACTDEDKVAPGESRTALSSKEYLQSKL